MKKIYQNTEKKEYVKPEVETHSMSYFCMKPTTGSGGGSAKAGEIFSDEADVEGAKPTTVWSDNEE